MTLSYIADRLEIEALLADYASAVDRQDWDLYRSVFTEEAIVDYVSAGGIKGTVTEVADWLAETMPLFVTSMHMVSNVRITFANRGEAEPATAATVEAMFHNPMLIAGDGSFTTGGWYHHRLVRTDAGWKSERLVEESGYFASLPQAKPSAADG